MYTFINLNKTNKLVIFIAGRHFVHQTLISGFHSLMPRRRGYGVRHENMKMNTHWLERGKVSDLKRASKKSELSFPFVLWNQIIRDLPSWEGHLVEWYLLRPSFAHFKKKKNPIVEMSHVHWVIVIKCGESKMEIASLINQLVTGSLMTLAD